MAAHEVIDAAARIAAAAGPISQEIKLVTGVVLGLRPVPPLAIRQAVLSVPTPKMPMVMIPDREDPEPNPNDPDYLLALDKQFNDQFLVTAEAMMLLGTYLKSVPEGAFLPEDDGWIEPLEALGIQVDVENKHKRYLSWLRYHAIATQNDQYRVLNAVTMMSGVTEVEVQRAAAAFRRDEERGADTDKTPPSNGRNRNRSR